MPTLEQVRAFLQKADNQNSLPSNYYRFFDMKDGEQATVRFLPDKNPENPYGFLIEKVSHTLTINGENKTVPCLGMYGEDCPICKLSSAYYKEQDKVNGKKYYKKRLHIGQVLVVEDPLAPDPQTGTNSVGQIRYVSLSYQIYQAIKAEFESAELDVEPWAYKGGTNFIIRKTKLGDYSTYVNSKFARKSNDLDPDTVARIEDQLIDLSTLLPPHPGREKVEQMLEAALTGAHFEAQKQSEESDEDAAPPWVDGKSENYAVPAAEKEEEPAAPPKVAVKETPVEEDGDTEADAILAQIRARRAAAK